MSLWLLSSSSQAALSAYEQALGDWHLKIKTIGGKLGGEQISQVIFPSSSVAKRALDCRLSLFQNGTFTLAPEPNGGMPLNGRWELGRNPYCPTDRFYDDLLLESYPRVLKRTGEEEVLQRVGFQLKCRIYGRYSGHERRLGRMNHGMLLRKDQLSDPPRTLLGWWKQRRVCASFTGTAIDNEEEYQ